MSTPIIDALQALARACQDANFGACHPMKLEVPRPVFDRLHAELKIFACYAVSGQQRIEDIWDTAKNGPTSITIGWIEVTPK